MEEIWKDIKGYEGYYKISNTGKVFSIRKNIIMSPGKQDKGYLFIYLTVNNNKKHFYIHRLVGFHFINNPENKPQINHKDLDKSNNYVNNLEWATLIENMQHASINGRLYCSEYQKQQTIKANSGENSKISKFKNSDIKQIRILKLQGLTNKAISNIYNVNRETIGYIIRGKTWKDVI